MTGGVHPVNDPADPRLDSFRDLANRTRDDSFIAESELAVCRALEAGAASAVMCTPARADRITAVAPPEVPVYVASGAILDRVVGFDFHRGCAAVGRRPRLAPADLVEIMGRPVLRILVLERLADPANLGAIIRTAIALSVEFVVVSEGGADPYARRAIRASMGNVFRVPVHQAPDIEAWAADARARGIHLLAAVSDTGAQSFRDVTPRPRCAVLLGNEGDGLSSTLKDLADAQITIPTRAGVDSLAVTAAAAILLHALQPD